MAWSPDVLNGLVAEYRAGKKEALPKIIAYCMEHKKDPPGWAKVAFIMASFFGRGPWESDFGRRPKDTFGKHYRLIRKGEAVYDRVEELRKANPVDLALFERVAAEFRVSAGTASALYYSSATRGSVADRDADREISQIEAAEIGPDPDRETRERWWEQNSERINEIIHRNYRAAHEKAASRGEPANQGLRA